MIYTAPSFLGTKWHSPIGWFPFPRAQKLSISTAQPPPTCPRNGYARIQNIMDRAVSIIGASLFYAHEPPGDFNLVYCREV